MFITFVKQNKTTMKKQELSNFYLKHRIVIHTIIIVIMLCLVGSVQDNQTR